MPRKKKIIESVTPIIIENQIEDLDIENEDEGSNNKAEILVGNNFKIIVSKRSYEVTEKYNGKTKNEAGEEIDAIFWRSHGFSGTLKYAFTIIREVIVKNKLFEKKTINSINEAIQVIKDSSEKADQLFEGIEI